MNTLTGSSRHLARLVTLVAVAFGIGLAAASPTRAAGVLTSGHTDIGVGYVGGEFEPHWHTHVGAVVDGVVQTADGEYGPADLIAQTTATRLTPSGGGGLSGLLGVPDGTQVWVMGSSTYQPNVGFGTEELNPADWSGPITITFNSGSSTLPGGAAFGLYTTNVAGTNVVDRFFSSVSGTATDAGNTISLNAGDHAHYQWAFTLQGVYDLNFIWSGTHVTDGFKSSSATFSVQAVPEPSTLAMLAVGGGTGAFVGVRRLRRTRPTTAG